MEVTVIHPIIIPIVKHEELLPCPFCGNKDLCFTEERYEKPGISWFHIECVDDITPCKANQRAATYEQAIERWNRRKQ